MSENYDLRGPVNGLLIKIDEETGERNYFGFNESEGLEVEEVYEAPENAESGYVGVPGEIRGELNEQVGEKIDDVWNVVVRNPDSGRYFRQELAKTTEELTTDGDSTADHPDSHAVMKKELIDALKLEKEGERETSNYKDKYEGAEIFASY
ncbi:MAG: hypothetical protein ACLFQ8_00840 [Candidatus Aenigmatarchaeota archaeon]